MNDDSRMAQLDDHLQFAVAHNDLLASRIEASELLRRFRAHPLPLNEPSLATHVALTGAVLNLEDAYANHMLHTVFHRGVDEATNYETRSMLALPLRTPRGTIIGVLQLINASRERNVIVPFTAESQTAAESYAAVAAVAVERARLAEGSFKDTVTDLYNGRYLGLRLQEETGRNKRFGYPVSLVSLNLDKFDRINRANGQSGGNAVLREVGGLLRRHSRQFTAAERIKGIIAAHPFAQGSPTASFGVAALPETAASPDELLGAASRSVSDAKSRGGNRVAAA